MTILNDSHFGSNLNDIQWLCQMISTNTSMNRLRISNCKHLLEFNKFHFLLQHGFLSHIESYRFFEEIAIDRYKHFNDECFKILLDVIDKKCPSLCHLHLSRTDISTHAVEALIAFLSKRTLHPLWSIDIEFCPKINDDASFEKSTWPGLSTRFTRKGTLLLRGRYTKEMDDAFIVICRSCSSGRLSRYRRSPAFLDEMIPFIEIK